MPPLGLIQRWEDLGKQLEKTIAAYLEACTTLESYSLVDLAGTRDLVPRIDSRLSSFHTLLSAPLASARSSIAQTRNKSVPSILRLPDEILSRIFRFALSSTRAKELGQLPYKYTAQVVYQRLHTIISVCVAWRRVGLESSFWTLVPVIHLSPGRYTSTAAQLSLERAANSRLHLSACQISERPDIDDLIQKLLSQHGPRFGSINIDASSRESMDQSLSALMEGLANNHSSLKELALCCCRSMRYLTFGIHIPLFHVSSYSPPIHKHVMDSLEVLRLSDLNISFEDVSMRSLTRVTLHRVGLDSKSRLSQFLRALGTSLQLRTLEIISVIYASQPGQFSQEGLPISLPSLQHLYLEDLSIDTLEYILESITRGSHLTTLGWTKRSFQDIRGVLVSSRLPIRSGLTRFKIDSLVFCPGSDPGPPTELGTYIILKSMPTITSLYLDSYALSHHLRNLMPQPEVENQLRADGTFADSVGNEFPKLKRLYINRSHFHDLNALRHLLEVVRHHQLEELGIGIGVDCKCRGLELGPAISIPHDQADIDSELGQVWRSLNDAVPHLIRLPDKASQIPDIPGFENQVWQL